MSSMTFGLTLLLLVQVPPPGAGAEAKWEALRSDREAIRRDEAAKLELLASKEEKAGRSAVAAEIRANIEPPTPKDGPIRLVLLPEIVPARPKEAIPPGTWQAEAKAIRDLTARALVALAFRAASKGTDRLALADESLRAAIARDPDHPEARRLLGYVPHEKGWATPGAIRRLKEGQVLDATYGWVPNTWPPRLAEGKLPGRNAAGPWLPAAEADALRSDIEHGWQIKSALHFRIQADVPLAEAIAFGRRLEALQDVFFSLFADVLGPAYAPIAQRFREKPGTTPTEKIRPFEVYYFADKGQYVDYLQRTQGRDESTGLGLYLPPGLVRGKPKKDGGRSYFYRDPGGQLDATATLFHEGSHQILFESAGSSEAYLKNRGHYWIWEGLGTYFETMTLQDDGSVLIGGLVGPRVASARDWLIGVRRFVPIAKLESLSQDGFNSKVDQAVYVHYAESMVLTIFLMHYDGGRYRDAFLDYVADAYDGKLRSPNALETRLGVSAETLDEQFLKWLDEGTRAR